MYNVGTKTTIHMVGCPYFVPIAIPLFVPFYVMNMVSGYNDSSVGGYQKFVPQFFIPSNKQTKVPTKSCFDSWQY